MRFTSIALLALVLICCRSKDENFDDIPIAIGDSILVWHTNADSLLMKRDTTIPDTAITVRRIINGLNQKYPEIQLVYLKQNNDTLYTRVPNGEYLGNQMGSAGASAWFADAAINLTSVPGINYVSFSMDTFSHAGSTVISRENYKNWKKQ